jgi:hypothetical protein
VILKILAFIHGSLYIRLFLKPFLYFNILSDYLATFVVSKMASSVSVANKNKADIRVGKNIESGNGWF